MAQCFLEDRRNHYSKKEVTIMCETAVAILMALLTCASLWGDDAEEKAADAIKKLGGTVVRDKEDTQKVVEVFLNHRNVTDADLNELKEPKNQKTLWLSFSP